MITFQKNPARKLAMILVVLAFVTLNSLNVRPAKAATISQTNVVETSLTAFEGIYQNKINTFFYFKITVNGTGLLAKQVDGDRQIILTRKSDLGFEMKDDDGDEEIPVTFSKKDAGEITGVEVGGRDQWVKVKEYVPVKEITLTADQLKAFEGKYKFEERDDAFLQITATATGLKLKQLWDNREFDFAPISDVDFLNKQAAFPLKFTKDGTGKVTKVLAFNKDLWDKVKE
ncbi:MAG TPA: hypothetical protein VL442_13480 [Mucilaginibacter sp.]|nr:hypothetical protein [Mucilaginibacter sp.]